MKIRVAPLELRQAGKHGTIVIGRSKGCALLRLAEAEKDSRRHAEVVLQNA